MTYWDRSLQFMRETVQEAPNDMAAELMLRDFIRSASEKAPVEELVKIGETMIENLKAHRRKHSGNN